MATVTAYNAKAQIVHSGTPYGNVWSKSFTFSTNSSGVLFDSTQATAILSGDIVRLGVIPAGTSLTDAYQVVSDAFAASTTHKAGFQYVDGVDSTAVPQDDDYFFGATAMDATGLTRKTTITRPVTLPKDAWFIITVGGANHSAVGVVDYVLQGNVVGAV